MPSLLDNLANPDLTRYRPKEYGEKKPLTVVNVPQMRAVPLAPQYQEAQQQQRVPGGIPQTQMSVAQMPQQSGFANTAMQALKLGRNLQQSQGMLSGIGNVGSALLGGNLNAALSLGPGATANALPIAAEYGGAGPLAGELFGSLGTGALASAAPATAAGTSALGGTAITGYGAGSAAAGAGGAGGAGAAGLGGMAAVAAPLAAIAAMYYLGQTTGRTPEERQRDTARHLANAQASGLSPDEAAVDLATLYPGMGVGGQLTSGGTFAEHGGGRVRGGAPTGDILGATRYAPNLPQDYLQAVADSPNRYMMDGQAVEPIDWLQSSFGPERAAMIRRDQQRLQV